MCACLPCPPSHLLSCLPSRLLLPILVPAGRYGLLGMLRCLATSYFCNLLGSLLLIGIMVGGEVFEGREEFVIE